MAVAASSKQDVGPLADEMIGEGSTYYDVLKKAFEVFDIEIMLPPYLWVVAYELIQFFA